MSSMQTTGVEMTVVSGGDAELWREAVQVRARSLIQPQLLKEYPFVEL